MGKGTIISGGTDGQYQLQINYDRTNYDNTISILNDNIATLEAKLAGLDPVDDKDEYNITELQKTAIELKKTSLESAMPEDETISAWCADLTENLSGEVGTVEIPGESENIQIQPGFEDNATYTESRQGQLVPTITQTPAQAFYNLALLPGWQKWKPTFRYGTITAIDGDTANVSIDNIKSSQQSLSINQTSTLSDVPIEYMNCDGDAFKVGDEVLIKFENQDWEQPKIVGFRDNPKTCEFYIKIKCNGVTPTTPKTVTLWYSEDGEEVSQSASSSAENPDLCGPFSGVSFPATIGLNNTGVPDDALHPDQDDKKLFHFWQEVDPVEYPEAKYLISKAIDVGYINGDMKQTLTNILYNSEPANSLIGSKVVISPVNYRKLSTQLTEIPSETTVFNFDGLKILQRRSTVNIRVANDPSLCSCGFTNGLIDSVPDQTKSPESDFQSVVYADDELVYNLNHSFVGVSDSAECPGSGTGYSAQYVGTKYYDGSDLNAKSLAILTDENGGNPSHVSSTFSYYFNGEIQALNDQGEEYVGGCKTILTELVTQTWILEMIDTPTDRF